MNHIFKKGCSVVMKNHLIGNNFHTAAPALAWSKSEVPAGFLKHNKKIYPPQEIGEEPRAAVSKRKI